MVQSQLSLECQGPVHCWTSLRTQWQSAWWLLMGSPGTLCTINVLPLPFDFDGWDNIREHIICFMWSWPQNRISHGIPWYSSISSISSHPTSAKSWSDALGIESGKAKHRCAGRSCFGRMDGYGWLGKASNFWLEKRHDGKVELNTFLGESVHPRLSTLD